MQSLLQSCDTKLQFPDYRSGLQDILASGGWSPPVDLSDVVRSSSAESIAVDHRTTDTSDNLEILREKVSLLERKIEDLISRQDYLEVNVT
jgi:hypothetical protein